MGHFVAMRSNALDTIIVRYGHHMYVFDLFNGKGLASQLVNKFNQVF